MRGLARNLAIVAVLAAGCGSSPSPTPIVIEAVGGHAHLAVELASTRLRVGEELAGTATLSLEGVDRLEGMASSGGPIDFELISADGQTRGFVKGTPDLRGFTLTANEPLVDPMPPSSSFNWYGPGQWRAAGTWTLEVTASFFAPTAEAGNEHHLKTSIEIEVFG